VLALAACGSSSPKTSSSSSADDCVDIAVNSLNTLDLTGVNPIDGLDATESAKVTSQLDAIEAAHPELAKDGRCRALIDGRPDDATVAEVIKRLKPEVIGVLGAVQAAAAQQSTFSSAGSAVN
jgi:hypothetical protein